VQGFGRGLLTHSSRPELRTWGRSTGGTDFEDGVLVVDRELSQFNRRALACLDPLEGVRCRLSRRRGRLLLTGRQRVTEDVDLILSLQNFEEKAHEFSRGMNPTTLTQSIFDSTA
jgi:hypothetical protein